MAKKNNKTKTKSNKQQKSNTKIVSSKAKNPNLWRHQGK